MNQNVNAGFEPQSDSLILSIPIPNVTRNEEIVTGLRRQACSLFLLFIFQILETNKHSFVLELW
jgi:hypothetical protein